MELCCLHCESVAVLAEFEFTEFISQDHEALQTKCANLLWNVASSHLKICICVEDITNRLSTFRVTESILNTHHARDLIYHLCI